MANVWFSVLVIFFIQNVLAYENGCPEKSRDILNCDQCLRCGGRWCKQPKNTNEHCSFGPINDEVPEKPKRLQDTSTKGDIVEPLTAVKTAMVTISEPRDFLLLRYNSTVQRNVTHSFINTTQNSDHVDVEFKPVKCDGYSCYEVYTTVHPGFCTSTGTDMEFFSVKLKVDNITEEAVIKYHVPCACGCSSEVPTQAQTCSGNGNYSCGICTCSKGWMGKECENKEEKNEGSKDCGEQIRGDNLPSCRNPLKDDAVCSDNGYCNSCGTCTCYSNVPGSQYFDPSRQCTDLCMDTSPCQHCLTNGTLGPCESPPFPEENECAQKHMIMLKYNDPNARGDIDSSNWVSCNITFKDPDCYVEYLAKKTNDVTSIMVVKSCNNFNAAPNVNTATEGSNVSIILGVLALLAVLVAVGGVVLWKHFHVVPPMPTSHPEYQNIDAEDCVGENPLYNPPISTFTNPQFGKCSD